MANLKYIGKNILNHDLEVKNGNIIGDHTEVIRVTVQSTSQGNKYVFLGALAPDLTLSEGKTYRFDQSDSTNDNHPFRFSIVNNGTWAGGSAYTTNVTTHGTPGVKGAYTEIKVTKVTPNHLYYYCTQHPNMGIYNDKPGKFLKNDLNNLHRVSGSAKSTGSFGLVEISGIDLDTTGVSRDQVLKFNGTNFVPAAFDATFVFTISDFDMSESTTPQLIGTGSWKDVGDITFTATYNNGPPDGFEGSGSGAPKIRGFVDGSVESSYDMFPLSSSFSTGTNPMVINYPPSTNDDIRFKLFASAGTDTDEDFTDQRIYFRNQFVYGELSKNNGFNQADIRTLAAANSITGTDTTRTLSGLSIGDSNYLSFAHRTGDTNVTQVYCGNNPNRLTVAMDRTDATTKTPLRETVSYLNTAGYTENFFVYASKIPNVDAHSTTFVTSTNNQIRNYIYWGTGSAWVNNEASVESLTNKNTSYDDGSITGNTLSVGSFTNQYVIVAIPIRYGDNDTDYQLKDNSTNLPFSFNQQSDVTVTNAVGFQEDYSVYRSTNLLTMTNATVLVDTV